MLLDPVLRGESQGRRIEVERRCKTLVPQHATHAGAELVRPGTFVQKFRPAGARKLRHFTAGISHEGDPLQHCVHSIGELTLGVVLLVEVREMSLEVTLGLTYRCAGTVAPPSMRDDERCEPEADQCQQPPSRGRGPPLRRERDMDVAKLCEGILQGVAGHQYRVWDSTSTGSVSVESMTSRVFSRWVKALSASTRAVRAPRRGFARKALANAAAQPGAATAS